MGLGGRLGGNDLAADADLLLKLLELFLVHSRGNVVGIRRLRTVGR